MGLSDSLVRDVGEFQLIDSLTNALPGRGCGEAGLVDGIGDDAAVWQPSAGEQVPHHHGCLIEDIHFELIGRTGRALATSPLAVNISDLAAMGGIPRLAVVTLGLRGDERIDDLTSLSRPWPTGPTTRCQYRRRRYCALPPLALMIHIAALVKHEEADT